MSKTRRKKSYNKKNKQRRHYQNDIFADSFKYDKNLRRKHWRYDNEHFQDSSKRRKFNREVYENRNNNVRKIREGKSAVILHRDNTREHTRHLKLHKVCKSRDERKKSLFATGKAGKGTKPNPIRRMTQDSKINCNRR